MQREETLSISDLVKVVEAVFAVGDPAVFEAYSAFDSDIESFATATDLVAYINRPRSNNKGTLGFAVHYPDTRGFVEKRKINLIKEKCEGHSYRYSMGGWGVIHLQINLQKAPNVTCRLAVNTEKRANTWFATYPEVKSPDLWDWKAVEMHARRLIRELKKHAQQGAPADISVGAPHRQSRG